MTVPGLPDLVCFIDRNTRCAVVPRRAPVVLDGRAARERPSCCSRALRSVGAGELCVPVHSASGGKRQEWVTAPAATSSVEAGRHLLRRCLHSGVTCTMLANKGFARTPLTIGLRFSPETDDRLSRTRRTRWTRARATAPDRCRRSSARSRKRHDRREQVAVRRPSPPG